MLTGGKHHSSCFDLLCLDSLIERVYWFSCLLLEILHQQDMTALLTFDTWNFQLDVSQIKLYLLTIKRSKVVFSQSNLFSRFELLNDTKLQFPFSKPPLSILSTHSGDPKNHSQAEWLVPLPEGLSEIDAMTIGTAGFTAALCVKALEDAEMPKVDTYKKFKKKNAAKTGLVRL